jgi:phospholipid transport system substrate-binding protein
MKFRTVISSLLVSVFLFQSGISIATNHSAGQVVKTTASRVIERLKAEKAQLDTYPDRIYSLINEVVIPHFDFTSMSRLVLGNAWNNATENQKSAFLEQFKTLLVKTYATALREYSDNEIVYHPEETKPGSRLVVVKTEVKGVNNGNTVPIDYRMHNVEGEWMVVDVAVDGVSLVSTYRGSFASEIRKSGLDALIARLVERNKNIGNPQ